MLFQNTAALLWLLSGALRTSSCAPPPPLRTRPLPLGTWRTLHRCWSVCMLTCAPHHHVFPSVASSLLFPPKVCNGTSTHRRRRGNTPLPSPATRMLNVQRQGRSEQHATLLQQQQTVRLWSFSSSRYGAIHAGTSTSTAPISTVALLPAHPPACGQGAQPSPKWRALSFFFPVGFLIFFSAKRTHPFFSPSLFTSALFQGYILYWNESPEKLYAHVSNSNNPVVGKKVGLVARLVDSSLHAGAEWTRSSTPPPVSAARVITGTLFTTFPDGTTSSEPMQDDGLHSDGLVGDGEYGGSVMATQAGMYRFHTTFAGEDAKGNAFVRSYTQDMMVDSPSATLMSYVVGTADKKNKRLSVKIPITVTSCSVSAV